MGTRYYIAYGSNLNLGQMKKRCPKAKIIGTAELHDYQLLFKKSESDDEAYLTIESKTRSVVPVAVWETTDSDEACLDIYEAYPELYYKKEMSVNVMETNTGKLGKCRQLTAYIYIMYESNRIGIPSDAYVKECLEGYRDFGFDEKYIAEALKISVEKHIKS